MNNKKVSGIIYEFILTCIGVFGIISVPLTCILQDISLVFAALLSIVGAALWVSVLNMHGRYRLAGAAGILVVTWMYAVLNMAAVKNSVIYCIQSFVEEVRRESGTVLAVGDAIKSTNPVFNESLLLVFTVLVGMVVAVEVIMLRSMAGAIITVIPVLSVFIGFSIVPATVSFLCCILYVFGASTHTKKSSKPTSGYIVLLMGLAVYLCITIFIPGQDYSRKEIFSSLYNKAEYIMGSISETFFGIDAPGGINYGQLGKINEVKFSDAKLATVTTIETGRNQYFKTYTGVEYQSDQWSQSDVKQDKMTDFVFNMMDASEELQNYITGESGADYYAHNKVFLFILRENSTEETKSYNGFSMADADYSKFKELADRKIVIKTNYEMVVDSLLLPIQFSSIEKLYRESVLNDYGKNAVPDSAKTLMEEVVGDVSVSTYNDKVEYIDYVKSFLSDNYKYTVTPGRVPEGRDFLEYFLKGSKEGYCTYFATAATIMFRYAGIPARYCEGYVLTNDKVITGTVSNMETNRYNTTGIKVTESEIAYTVELTDRNAHAWVEIYMDGYGWIPIEVTPGRSRNDYMSRTEITGDGSGQRAPTSQEEQQQTQETLPEAVTEEAPEETQTATEQVVIQNDENVDSGNGLLKQIKMALFIFVCIFALLMAIWLVILLRMCYIKNKREKFLKERNDENVIEQITDLYEYFIEMLKMLGYNKPPGMDYEEYVHMIEGRDDQLRKCNIFRIMTLLLRSRFSNEEELTDSEFEELTSSLHKMRLLVYSRTKGAKKLRIKYIDVL